METNGQFLNVDLINNFFVWLPPRTATRQFSRIFENSDFKSYKVENNKLKFSGKINGTHDINLFEGHEKFNLIMTIRNPYEMLYSWYVNLYNEKKDKEKLKDGFSNYMEIVFIREKSTYLQDLNKKLETRLPDYIIKTENILDGYSRLPFIGKYPHYKEFLQDKFGESKLKDGIRDSNWKENFTQKSADLIYYNLSNFFDIFGYEKNSWK